MYICVDYFFFRFKFVSSCFFCRLFHLVQCWTCSTWIACKNFTLAEKISWIRQQKFSLPWFHYKNKNKTSTHNHKANFNWFLPRFTFHPFSQLILFFIFLPAVCSCDCCSPLYLWRSLFHHQYSNLISNTVWNTNGTIWDIHSVYICISTSNDPSISI